MGVIQAVSDAFALNHDRAWLYGGSGHAFLLSIHPHVCPSGPSCWNEARAFPLLRNLGIAMEVVGACDDGTEGADRASVEVKLKAALDDGRPCAVVNLENQVITGYDREGFTLAQPWGSGHGVTPARLSFGSWKEFSEAVRVCFYTFANVEPASTRGTVAASLRYALDLREHPTEHAVEGYGVGPDGYRLWLEALDTNTTNAHGAWWNATVWSECRMQAARYFEQVQGRLPRSEPLASELAEAYEAIAQKLRTAAARTIEGESKRMLVAEAADQEAAAEDSLRRLLGRLEAC